MNSYINYNISTFFHFLAIKFKQPPRMPQNLFWGGKDGALNMNESSAHSRFS